MLKHSKFVLILLLILSALGCQSEDLALYNIDKRIILDNEAITVHTFKNEKEMEREASKINKTGNEYYEKGEKIINIDWVASPHLYKKGRIIVEYIGDNENIINDSNEIL